MVMAHALSGLRNTHPTPTACLPNVDPHFFLPQTPTPSSVPDAVPALSAYAGLPTPVKLFESAPEYVQNEKDEAARRRVDAARKRAEAVDAERARQEKEEQKAAQDLRSSTGAAVDGRGKLDGVLGNGGGGAVVGVGVGSITDGQGGGGGLESASRAGVAHGQGNGNGFEAGLESASGTAGIAEGEGNGDGFGRCPESASGAGSGGGGVGGAGESRPSAEQVGGRMDDGHSGGKDMVAVLTQGQGQAFVVSPLARATGVGVGGIAAAAGGDSSDHNGGTTNNVIRRNLPLASFPARHSKPSSPDGILAGPSAPPNNPDGRCISGAGSLVACEATAAAAADCAQPPAVLTPPFPCTPAFLSASTTSSPPASASNRTVPLSSSLGSNDNMMSMSCASPSPDQDRDDDGGCVGCVGGVGAASGDSREAHALSATPPHARAARTALRDHRGAESVVAGSGGADGGGVDDRDIFGSSGRGD